MLVRVLLIVWIVLGAFLSLALWRQGLPRHAGAQLLLAGVNTLLFWEALK